jgi:hypothetical protein
LDQTLHPYLLLSSLTSLREFLTLVPGATKKANSILSAVTAFAIGLCLFEDLPSVRGWLSEYSSTRSSSSRFVVVAKVRVQQRWNTSLFVLKRDRTMKTAAVEMAEEFAIHDALERLHAHARMLKGRMSRS